MRCAIQTCGGKASEVVDHLGRPEAATPLCDLHATRVRRHLGSDPLAVSRGGSIKPDAARFAKRTLPKGKDPEEGEPEQLTLPHRAGLTVSLMSGGSAGDVLGRRGTTTDTTHVDTTPTTGEQTTPMEETDG